MMYNVIGFFRIYLNWVVFDFLLLFLFSCFDFLLRSGLLGFMIRFLLNVLVFICCYCMFEVFFGYDECCLILEFFGLKMLL